MLFNYAFVHHGVIIMRILLIHQYTVIRKILQNHILTENNDAIVDMLPSPEGCSSLLKNKQYDIVFSGLEMSGLGMDGFAVHNEMLSTQNKNTPIIVMTSSFDKEHLDQLQSQGMQYVLPIPFTQQQLRSLITKVFDPTKDRAYTRYVIPQTNAVIQIDNGNPFKGEVINISLNGILCELDYPKSTPNIMKQASISIIFPKEYCETVVSGIMGSIIRMSAKSWQPDNTPSRIRIVWKFVYIPNHSRTILARSLEKADKDLSETEKEFKKT